MRPSVRGVLKSLPLAAMLAVLADWAPAAERPAPVPLPGTPIEFNLPIGCIPGQNCWILNYLDHAADKDARDFRCGFMRYDGHTGTDFAIADLAAMRRGVTVIAAAAGTVRAIRDDMDDVSFRDRPIEEIAGKGGGNQVQIDHGNGWVTLYWHLRKGSVRVKTGDQVKEGQPLGLVGLSGSTEFPHLHFQVQGNDQPVDPFVGTVPSNCGATVKPLWKKEVATVLPYQRAIPYIAGLTDKKPEDKAARDGTLGDTEIAPTAPEIQLWADVMGIEAGDAVTFRFFGPNASLILEHTSILPRNRQRQFLSAGLKRQTERWAPGTYRGEIEISPRGSGSAWHNQVRREATVR